MIPDYSYSLKIGDRVALHHRKFDTVPVASNIKSYAILCKSMNASDEDGLAELRDKKQAAALDNGTEILVLQVIDNKFLADHTVVEARIMSGPMKTNLIIVDAEHVARMIKKPRSIPGPTPEQIRVAKEKREERDRANFAEAEEMLRKGQEAREEQMRKTRAAYEHEVANKAEKQAEGLLQLAMKLEKSGKRKGALDFYRRVVKGFPGTPQAVTAAKEIQSLTNK